MTERLQPPSELDTFRIADRSLNEWHTWLNTDRQTGEDAGHLACPGSRYGRTSADNAWFAIATEVAFVHANGDDGETEESLDALMGMCVNDNEDIAPTLLNNWHTLPRDLRQQLGGIAAVRGLVW